MPQRRVVSAKRLQRSDQADAGRVHWHEHHRVLLMS
jgi:hypothetical protein